MKALRITALNILGLLMIGMIYYRSFIGLAIIGSVFIVAWGYKNGIEANPR